MEKNEEADQKIEQDGTTNKPEDKAHKAATKIQASFRGHITRKKMKDGEEEKEGDSPAAAEEATEGGEEAKKAEEEEAPAKQEEAAGEEAKKEEETSQAKSPVADKPANSPAGAATSPVAAAPAAVSPTAATAPSEPKKEEPKVEEKAEEKPKEVETPAAAANSPTTATAEEKEEESEEKKEEARQADVPAAVSLTAEKEEPNQTKDKQGMHIILKLLTSIHYIRIVLKNPLHAHKHMPNKISPLNSTCVHKFAGTLSLETKIIPDTLTNEEAITYCKNTNKEE